MERVGQAALSLAIVLVLAGSTWGAVTVQGSVSIIFTSEERKIIKEYYSKEIIEQAGGRGKAKQKGLPPGLAKREKLPPGLQKQLQRNGTLPPGLPAWERNGVPGRWARRDDPVQPCRGRRQRGPGPGVSGRLSQRLRQA